MSIRSGKTIRMQAEYEKAKANGKKVLLVDKEQLEKELLGAETPSDKLYKKLKGDEGMSEKRFKLSRFAIPSELSDFCDENGRMLNSEVVRMLNERDKQQLTTINMFFKIKELEEKIRRLKDRIKALEKNE